jgi:histidinol dehydrogenase
MTRPGSQRFAQPSEHDESAQSILITDDAEFGEKVMQAVTRQLETLDRRAIAGASWRDFGAVIVVNDMAEAAALSNRLAPEHLELCVADPDGLAAQITHAGAIFLGAWTPEAIGDYIGGPNHVLPTAGPRDSPPASLSWISSSAPL